MKELLFILLMSMVLLIVGCEQPEREYSTEEAREALDAGEDLQGAVVVVDVDILEDNPFFGPAIRTENFMTFISKDDRPPVQEGDRLKVRVIDYENVMDAWVIVYH